MQPMYYIGLDVHKKTISYCVKDGSGQIHAEGTDSRHTFGSGPLDENPAAAVDARRWKPRCSPAGSTIICCRTPPR